MSAMGMMHEGYFVGRKELTAWVQQNFQPSFNKVEDCASGVVYCQIVDSVYPGAVPMSKVKMQAKTEVDFIHNFKILQTAFSKKKIDRYIDVDKLTKRSFQHNMEFLQFMKCYWDMHAPGAGSNENAGAFAEAVANEPAPAAQQRKAPAAEKAEPPSAKGMGSGPKRTGAPPKQQPAAAAAPKQQPAAAAPASSAAAAAAAAAQEELTHEVSELKLSVENLERERDFYYSKLREVEVLCQANEGSNVPFLQQVLDILYKTDDADEFVTPEDEEPEPVAAM